MRTPESNAAPMPQAPSTPAPARPATSRSAPAVAGYLTHNWGHWFDRPAVIINPEARVGDVLAWCWAEVSALLAAAQAIDESDVGNLSVGAVFLHRLEPLERMLDHAVSLLPKPAASDETSEG
jgi:hypothetical protein